MEHIRYSKQIGFMGITQQDKDQWMQKYPYITDFEINVKECKEWLSKNWNQAYLAQQRPRDFLDKWLGCEWLKLNENINKEPEKLHNPKQLINFIDKYFDNQDFIAQITRGKQEGYSDTLARKHYDKAHGYAVKLRKEIPEFTETPDATEKAHFDLHKLQEWCIECEQIIEDLYAGIKLDNISKVLSVLNELRELLKDNEPQIDINQWNKIRDRIWKELETLGKILKNSKKSLRHWKCRAVSDQDYELLISKMTENKLYVPDDRNELIEIINAAESMAEVDWDKAKAIVEDKKSNKAPDTTPIGGLLPDNAADKLIERMSILSSAQLADNQINKLVWKNYCRKNPDYAEKYSEKEQKIGVLFDDSANIINSDTCLTKVAFLREEKLNSGFKRLDYNLYGETSTEIVNDKVLKEIIAELEVIKNDASKHIPKPKSKEKNEKEEIVQVLQCDENDFLSTIAKKVDFLVNQAENMNHFREQVQAFFTEVQKAETELDKILKSTKESQAEVMEVPYYQQLLSLLSLPSTFEIEELVENMGVQDKNEISEEINLQADYVKLAIIHDKRLKGPTTPKINNNIWPQSDSRITDIWNDYKNKGIYGEGQSDIESTFERVNADLPRPLKPLKLNIVQSSFRGKEELTQWVRDTAGKTLHRPDAKIITAKPFQDGGGYIHDANYVKQKQLAIKVELEDEQKELISEFVGEPFSYGQNFIDRLECAIIQKCGIQNVKAFTWSKIISCIEK